MGGFRRAAPNILTHVNCLLLLYAGAALASAARLTWDPSTYLAVRLLAPTEGEALAAMLGAGGLALLVLSHAAALARSLRSNDLRRRILLVYAGSMTVLVLCELVWAIWMAVRVVRLIDSETGELLTLLVYFTKIFKYFKSIISEEFFDNILPGVEDIIDDVIHNVRLVVANTILLVLLQLVAIALALYCARTSQMTPTQLRRQSWRSNNMDGSTVGESRKAQTDGLLTRGWKGTTSFLSPQRGKISSLRSAIHAKFKTSPQMLHIEEKL